ncbi:MAG: RagB/SusD family nutrient uptake outer membrane protein, partial [Bacteroidales bacterium]|nr:RagB/SusD family nutrient uptake outer membrane protein [Bacteroidales bacterium]
MKKQLSKTGLILIFLISFTGCEEFLDRYPSDALTSEQIFADLEGAQTTITALYDLLSDNYLLGRSTMLRGSLKGADFFHFTENPNKRFDSEYKYAEIASSAGYAGYIWNYAYKTIASCNRIEAILPEIEGDSLLKSDMLGQTKAIKAICYSELLRAFCYPKWMADDDPQYAMGVPLLKNTNDNAEAVENSPVRSSLDDCYDYVDELLLDALDLIDADRTGKQYITKQAIWVLLARNYLYTERWDDAAEAAVNAENLGSQMIDKASFIENMTVRFNDESVFELYYDVNDNLGTGCIAYYAFKSVNAEGRIDENSIGYGDYGASNAFINLFD